MDSRLHSKLVRCQGCRCKVSAGFTLIEILLVIAIVLTVGFLSSAYPLRLMSQMAVRNSADEIRSVLWKAQTYALAGRGHSAWGVHYSNSALTLFKGDVYNNRDQSLDEKTALDEKVVVAGFTEAVFTTPGGKPQEAIPIITLSQNGLSEVVSLNAEGVVE